jgi:hypothetical protein
VPTTVADPEAGRRERSGGSWQLVDQALCLDRHCHVQKPVSIAGFSHFHPWYLQQAFIAGRHTQVPVLDGSHAGSSTVWPYLHALHVV